MFMHLVWVHGQHLRVQSRQEVMTKTLNGAEQRFPIDV